MSLEGSPGAAAVYCRISDDRDGRALGVARQEADCRALADRKGWPIADVYVDNDISAASRRRRPEYQRLLEDLKAGRVDGLVVWDLDRLHRRPLELEGFFEIADGAGMRYLATVSGDVDLATGDGLLVARIKGAVAADEVRKIRQRVSRKHRELAESGKLSGGGTRPFGFDSDRMTIRADEAAVLRDLASRVLAGESLRSLCVELNDREVFTSTGKRWAPSSLRRTLMSGRIAGLREHHGEIVGPAVWDGIISEAQSAQLRTLFNDPARRAKRASRRYLLSGLVRCGSCGAVMVARPRDDGKRRYVCARGPGFAGCGHMLIVADELEELISEAVLVRLDSPELFAAMTDRSKEAGSEVSADLAADDAQLEELARAYGERVITLREYLAARKPIEARIEAGRRQLSKVTDSSALHGFIGHADHLRSVWDTMTPARRQAVIGAVLDHVAINPGIRGLNRFDPNRVVPLWKL